MSAEDELELDNIEPTEEVENTPEVPVEETPVVEHTEFEKKQYERAKKAEAELKEAKQKLADLEEAKAPQPTNSDFLSRDEGILIAQGMSAEELDELKDIATAKGLPLLKAKETPIFKAYLEAQEAERKKEKAKLSSSKGSQVTQTSETKSLVDMTPEEQKQERKEHEALVREEMAKVR